MKTNSLTYAAVAILTTLFISSCSVDDDFQDLEKSTQPASKERSVLEYANENNDNHEEIVFKVNSSNDVRSDNQQNRMSKFKITAYEDGFNFYNGRTDEVTTSDNGNSWISDYNRYWPGNRPTNWKGLTFYAYAETMPKGNTYSDNYQIGNLDCTYNVPIIKNFSVNDEVKDQRNLIYSVAKEVRNTNQNSEVNLNFKSALCKVNFTAENSNPNFSNIEIVSIEIGGVKGEGNFQFPDYSAIANKPMVLESDCQGKWMIPASAQDKSYKLNDINLNIGSAGQSNSGVVAEELYLIPQKAEEFDESSTKGGFIKVSVKITSKGSTASNKTKDIILPTSIDWQEGKTYTYNIKWTPNFIIHTCRESN